MDARFEKKLKDARDSLLDLTMRNRLLNYRPTKARSVRLLRVDARQVLEVLVGQERSVIVHGQTGLDEFFGTTESDVESTVTASTDIPEVVGQEQGAASHPRAGSKTAGSMREAVLPFSALAKSAAIGGDMLAEVAIETGLLLKKLRCLESDARSVVEDRGYNVLYLALGFLEWRETDTADSVHRAPLVLVPVELKLNSRAQEYRLGWNGDDVQSNVSLEAMLSEQHVTLPDLGIPETAADLDGYFRAVAAAIPPGWQVVDLTELDFFSFARFAMYRDLDPKSWPDAAHFESNKLLRTLLLGESMDESGTPGFDLDAVDDKLRAADLLHVVDADPSQIAVIEDAKSGRSLVVEGPPGTGKSQTIVNIIAELLGQGKTVLFVSQKMAALDVVKRRLDDVGLGSACLELHSDKATKQYFVDQLRLVIEHEACPVKVDSEDYDRVDELRVALNAYAHALGEPVGATKLSPFALFGMKEQALHRLRPTVRGKQTPEFDGSEHWSAPDIIRYRASAADLARHTREIGVAGRKAWQDCETDRIMPNDVPDIDRTLTVAIEMVGQVSRIGVELEDLGVPHGQTIGEIRENIQNARDAAECPSIETSVAMNNDWNTRPEDANRFAATVHYVQSLREEMNKRFRAGLVAAVVESGLETYRDLCEKHGYYETVWQRIGRLFNRSYRRARADVESFFIDIAPKSDRQLVDALQQSTDYLKQREWLAGCTEQGVRWFGEAWKGEDSSDNLLSMILEWMPRLYRGIGEGKLTPAVLAAVGKPGKARLAQVEEAMRSLSESEASVNTACESVGYRGDKAVDVFPDVLIHRLTDWHNAVEMLPAWSQYVTARAQCSKMVGQPFVKLAESGQLRPEEMEPFFDICLANSLLRTAFAERLPLRNFSSTSHEAAIEEYVKLDQHIIKLNRQRLARLIEDRRPPIGAKSSSGSGAAGIIMKEVNRKRRHRPIRALLRDTGGYVQLLKPCFLMSPLSVAQFLDPTAVKFDCIIFDEASQVKPEEALGTLFRGSQLIVMGDTKQLPPTAFFDRLISDDDAGDEDPGDVSARDIESLLHMCKAAMPQSQKSLLWHYRSHHESLIAVSNREFYENRLRVYPSPVDVAPGIGLSFVHVPDGIYDRGRSRTNKVEAAEVARRVATHYHEYPDQSVGVGTFNLEQQRAIEDELVLLRQQDPELDQYFDHTRSDYCFVKNIETIQGDEREVIFVSVGYGFDETQRFSRNFGPINQDGGERRLNVLMTRARRQCVIFANFHYDMLPAGDAASKGLSALRSFMEYAETRQFATTSIAPEDAESPFEEAVGELLVEAGFAIHRQVGCAGFRVDIGIVHPRQPGRYLCGVECDGASYHSARVARDRDRLRQQILEGLGWTIVRVWSTDWFLNRARARADLLDKIRSIAESDGDPESPAPQLIPVDPGGGQSVANKHGAGTVGAGEAPAATSAILTKRRQVETIDVQAYKMCTSTRVPITVGLLDASVIVVGAVVADVVLTEGPIHETELVRRVRDLWGYHRAGPRIQEKINRAIQYMCSWGAAGSRPASLPAGLLGEFLTAPIVRRGEFVWPTQLAAASVRQRMDPTLAKIGLICDEEITAAIILVLGSEYSSPLDELCGQALRLLGIQAVHADTRERVRIVVDLCVRKKQLKWLPNGQVALVERKPSFKVETL